MYLCRFDGANDITKRETGWLVQPEQSLVTFFFVFSSAAVQRSSLCRVTPYHAKL